MGARSCAAASAPTRFAPSNWPPKKPGPSFASACRQAHPAFRGRSSGCSGTSSSCRTSTSTWIQATPSSSEQRKGIPCLGCGTSCKVRVETSVQRQRGGGSMPKVTTSKPQTISYPAPGSRPYRHEDVAVDPHVVVLFGATGDLARRKLIPGLAYLDQSELAPHIEIVATSLEDISTEEFLDLARTAIDDYGTHKLTDDQWNRFAEIVTYVPQGGGPEALADAVAKAEEKLGAGARRLHYLSVPPKAARSVITMLRDANLVGRSRVVMEKPFGTDLASAVALNDFVHETFSEDQIFRIDHFLGKEAAQNILAFRFANGLFEPIWNRNFIDHIQIDIPEDKGLEQRANFYESTGAYKDMVVTHLLQVMAFVVMEPPTALEPFAISEEKNKVFRSMLPVKPSNVVRGQYQGYRDED